jgi:hypothetical protein
MDTTWRIMTREDFIEGVSVSVQDSAVKTVISELTVMRHAQANVDRIAWYSSLSTRDREWTKEVARFAVDTALFGMFCVLDGVRAFEDAPGKGELRLVYSNAERGVEVQLNGSGGNDLHDIFHDYMDWAKRGRPSTDQTIP